MSWHYLRGREVDCWDHSSLDGAPQALLRLIPGAGTACCSDSPKGICRDSRFGMTSGHLTDGHGEVISTSSAADSPVRTSARRVPVKELPEHVQDWYSKCSELLTRLGLRSSSRKTAPLFVPVGWPQSSRDLQAWGIWDESGYWGLWTSVRTISERECGLLPTPRASRWGLEDSHGSTDAWKAMGIGGKSVALREWMMGWPIGWTDTKRLGMDRYRQWLHSHGGFLQPVFNRRNRMATMEFKVNLEDEEGIAQIQEMLTCYMNGCRIKAAQDKHGITRADEVAAFLDKCAETIKATRESEDEQIQDTHPPYGPGPKEEEEEVELDTAGEPWDPAKHSAGKTRLADGTWRRKRIVEKKEDKPVPPPPEEDASLAPEEVSYTTMIDILKGKNMDIAQMNALAKQVGVASIGLVISSPELIPAILALAESK